MFFKTTTNEMLIILLEVALSKDTFLSTGGLTFNGDTILQTLLMIMKRDTWTAALNTVNNNATVSPGNTTGYYVKVGNMVRAHYYTDGDVSIRRHF